MNLKLYALRSGNSTRQIQLVVIDLDKSQYYPLNFVCVLPKYFRFIEKRPSKFVSIFGQKSPQIAKNLLIKAFHNEKDPEIRRIIKNRIGKLPFIKENSGRQVPKSFVNSI